MIRCPFKGIDSLEIFTGSASTSILRISSTFCKWLLVVMMVNENEVSPEVFKMLSVSGLCGVSVIVNKSPDHP